MPLGYTQLFSTTGGLVLRADATAYINAIVAAGAILTNTQKLAINTRFADINGVTNLSYATSNYASKLGAMYLFLGGNGATNAVNALNPGTFNLTYGSPAPTHSSNGIYFNGTNNYANTNFNPYDQAVDNIGLSVYIREDLTNTTSQGQIIGAYSTGCVWMQIRQDSSGGCYFYANSNFSAGLKNVASTKGFISFNRINTTQNKAYKNGSLIGSAFTDTFNARTNTTIMLGGWNNAGTFSSCGTNTACTFSYMDIIISPLSDTDHLNNYNSIQALQTAFSRNV